MGERFWVVIPAAGVGRRMAGDVPKQYLPIADRTVIEWSISPFIARNDIAGVMVALAPDDARFTALAIAKDKRVRTTVGGIDRADSVLNGLAALDADENDWVLVHDAARPCITASDLSQLIAELGGDSVGGLLACPVTDTLKSADASRRIDATVPRDKLWRALTPQMFRYGVLHRALTAAVANRFVVTDEASAVESLGLRPKLVLGRGDNIKITVPEDLAYADYLLRARMQAR